MVGRRTAGWAAGLLLVALSAPTAQAQAPLPSVLVPRHDGPAVALTLVGASADAVLVDLNDLFDYSEQKKFGGALGSVAGPPTLLSTPEALASDNSPTYRMPLGVVGDTFAWCAVTFGTDGCVLHRTNLLTGGDVAVKAPTLPVAFTGDSWLAWSGTNLVRTTFDGARTTVLTGAYDYPNVVADSTGALVSSWGPVAGKQPRRQRLDLVTFGSGTQAATVERLVDSLDSLGSLGLSGQTVAWQSQATTHPVSINQRARTGGVISTGPESGVDIDESLPSLAVGAGRVGYLISDATGTYLRIQTGGSVTATVTEVPLPADSSGVDAVGDRFFTATGGPPATAGVYAIDGSTVTRVAAVPVQQIGVVALAFSNSRLYYADESSPTAPGLTVWQREVSGRTTPELSAESLFGQRASTLGDIAGRSISISAGRGAVRSPDLPRYQWRFFDRGVSTGRVTWTRLDFKANIHGLRPNVSGPYTLIGGRTYRPNGSLIFTRPGKAGAQFVHDDLFGNRLIYSLANVRKNTSTVWLHDLTKPKSPTNPVRLVRGKCADRYCAPRVAIWGDIVAWEHDQHIRVRNLKSGRSRTVTARFPVEDFELGEGTLAWANSAYANGTGLLDLRSSTSKPVAVSGTAGTLALDDHRLARIIQGSGQVVVSRLPFGGKYRPRLIGTLAPAGFTPNGDGRADTWAPAFDTTKPLTGVTLRIKGSKSGRTLRTLTGTGPDGSVRDLVWDGRTGAGRVLAAGTYRWELAARAADGEGSLIPAHAGRTLTGTVRLAG